MKVIKEGQEQKAWSKECICTGVRHTLRGGCGAVLLVEEGDLFQTRWGSGMDDYISEITTTFKCACCGVKTDVDAPKWLKVRKEEFEVNPWEC